MGAQWKHAGRLDAAAKKGAMVGKLVKEIMVAAKLGGADPDTNARLRAALEDARKASVTRDTIERAIKKGAGLLGDPVNYETVIYEGFAPAKVPVIVECLTDNKNRTASDIRNLFKDGHLGTVGSVAWMFDRIGVVDAHHPDKNVDVEAAAIEAGAQNFEPLTLKDVPETHVCTRFTTNPTDLDSVGKWLTAAKWVITTSELSYHPKNMVDVSDADRKIIEEFLGDIDDHDDVHRIYAALK